ncbi:MAG TPA: FABP family protein [Humibacter sp.]|nr:FABP family protein [Humibacter sp.]
MIEIPSGLPAELVPLSWLLGVWEGTGVVDYVIDDEPDAEGRVEHVQLEFGQRVSFSQDGLPYLNYTSYTWVLDEQQTPLAAETGYWRLGRLLTAADPGPGMLPGAPVRPFTRAEAVETLRNARGGFDLEVSIVHPDGVSELYLGQVAGPRIDLATDAVMRTASAKDYAAATRLYGLVDAHLLWAWDIAALGNDLRTHASARLAKVD